jgi:SAM-dependent methyltransferase
MNTYSKQFFLNQTGVSSSSASIIVPLIMELVRPNSVVDIGCGTGDWLSEFKRRGVTKIKGFDGNWVPRSALLINESEFQEQDLRQPIQLSPSDMKFDLSISLEVGEHLPASLSKQLVENLVTLSSIVLFSAATPFQGGTDHINEQWPAYWVQIFKEFGYTPIDCIRQRVWNIDGVAWWYAQNIILFVSERNTELLGKLKEECGKIPQEPIPLVHPKNFLLKVSQLDDPSSLGFWTLLKALPSAFIKSIRRYLEK